MPDGGGNASLCEGDANDANDDIGANDDIDANGAVTKPRIVMVGMHLTKTRGGISTLNSEILRSPIQARFDFKYIESQAEDFGPLGKSLLALKALAEFLATGVLKRPRLVYIHFGSNASLYREAMFVFLGKCLGTKVVGHFHAGDVDLYFPRQHWIGKKFIRTALQMCDSIIAVSNKSAIQLQRIASSARIHVITNAIDTGAFDFPIRDRDKPPLDDPPFHGDKERDDAVRILFVGAIGKLKGEQDLIDALTILRDTHPQLKVSILGYGAERLWSVCVARNISDSIEYLGAVSLSERIRFFARADVFVLPTYAEAMPMSVIEAMAAGLPVISTTVGGITELIENGVDGFLIEPGDVSALAEKIAMLADDQRLRSILGMRARQKAQEQMDITQYVKKLENHLSNVLKGSAAA